MRFLRLLVLVSGFGLSFTAALAIQEQGWLNAAAEVILFGGGGALFVLAAVVGPGEDDQ